MILASRWVRFRQCLIVHNSPMKLLWRRPLGKFFPFVLFFSLGKWDFSYFSTLSGLDGAIVTTGGGSDWGYVSEVNRLAVLDPLRVILADGREADGFGFLCKDLGAGEEVIDDLLERAIQEVLEKEEEAGTIRWSSSCLAKFSRCIGMPTKGFEGEILTLLNRMKERKDQKGKLDGRKRKKLELSRFERELRKLECTVNYIGGGEEKGGNILKSR